MCRPKPLFASGLLTKEVDITAHTLSSGNVHCRHLDLCSSERHLGLYFPGPRHARGRRRQVGNVQPQRSAAGHSGIRHELNVRRLRAVDVEDARCLVAFGRRVPPRHRAAHEDGVPGADEPVEDARTPVDAVTLDQAGLGVTTANKPTNDADAVRLARPTYSHRRRIKPEAHRTCIATNRCD